MVPLSAVATFRYGSGPIQVTRYNNYPAAELQDHMAQEIGRGARHGQKPLGGKAEGAPWRKRRYSSTPAKKENPTRSAPVSIDCAS